MNREEVIKDLAGLVGNMNPDNKVDLTNPEFTIVVEIIRNVCCLSVVRDYTLFRKYNLQEVIKSTKAEKPQEPAGDAGKEKTQEQSKKDPAVVGDT
ncbi:THUMP domain-containing protein 1-like [Dendrobates tinctorius]|uniref:THUMP domain-containing protein 1-like n=1 Tax=Dendrobates tinctorius TaxID=92724 RepID=UPI003CC955F1